MDTLFTPKAHGLAAPWAAGVRKRLSPQSQAALKDFYDAPFGIFTYVPVHLVLAMDKPKDAAHLLDFVEAIPDQAFSRQMHAPLVGDNPAVEVVRNVLAGHSPSDGELEEYRRAVGRARIVPPPSPSEVRRLFAEITNPAQTKQRWVAAMREYHTVFFAQEEVRLAPVLKKMLVDAQSLAKTLSVTDLIERISNGFTISEESDLKRLVLVPSVWCSPFVITPKLDERSLLLIWGARPSSYKLAPGESVPDQATLVLRALSDPTRLRLLRLLSKEPRSPQALARELKLSLPTVSHHMRELRLAGLVRLEERVGDKSRERRYTVRWQSAERAFNDLTHFVTSGHQQD